MTSRRRWKRSQRMLEAQLKVSHMASSFRVAARALRQMGAELITSDDVALNELIKNAFDAQPPRVEVMLEAPADVGALSLLLERLLANPAKIGNDEAREIGRASCRERG